MHEPEFADQQEHAYNSSVRTQDVVLRTMRERWMIGTNGERQRDKERDRDRELGKHVLAVRLYDDDIYIYIYIYIVYDKSEYTPHISADI